MNWLRRLMYGRYGFDALSNFILIAGVVIYFIFALLGWNWLLFIPLLCVVYTYFRCFSKNIQKRYAENEKFKAFFRPPQPSSESEKGCGRTGKATNIISAQNAGSIFALQKEKVRSN